MDVRMPELDGLEATREIKAEHPGTNVLVLTTYEDLDYLFEAVKAGAVGYVIKDATKREFVNAVRKALDGQPSLDQELAMRLLQRLGSEEEQRAVPSHGSATSLEPLPEPLTPREIEVLRLLARRAHEPADFPRACGERGHRQGPYRTPPRQAGGFGSHAGGCSGESGRPP